MSGWLLIEIEKKWFEKWICCSTHQPIGNGYFYSIFGLILTFFGAIRMCLVVIGGETSSKKAMAFLFRSRDSFFCEKMCTVLAKQHNCRFLVLKTNIQNVVAGVALFTVVETSRYIGWNVNLNFNSSCWTKHISDSLSYFVVHTQFFLSTFGWLKRGIRYYLFVVYQFHLFLANKKRVLSVFVVFTCSCNLRNFVNKQPGSTLSTTMIGSRSCYITTKKFSFLSVEKKGSRTLHISNNFLNWLWSLFKNANPLSKWQGKRVYLFFKKILRTWHGDPQCGHWWSLLPRDWKVFLCRQSLPKHFVFGQNTSPMKIIVLFSNPQSGVIALHIVIALKYITLVSNKKSILVEIFYFKVTQVDNFSKNELITVIFKLFDGKEASFVLFKPEG